MVDTSFRLETKSNGRFVLPYDTANPTVWTRGSTATYEFEFPIDTQFTQDYTVSGHETYGNIEITAGTTLTIPNGATLETDSILNHGTLDNQGTILNSGGMLAALHEFVEWAGNYTTQTMINGIRKYRVQIPDTVGIDSLVVGVQPSNDLQDRYVSGVWGLLDSVSNERTQSLSTNRYQLSVTVLAPYEAYSSVASVETDLLI